jgi:hypothetical protein
LDRLEIVILRMIGLRKKEPAIGQQAGILGKEGSE